MSKEMAPIDNAAKGEMIKLAAEGKTITEIRAKLNIAPHELRKLLESDLQFHDDFSRARQDGLEELADSLLTIPEQVPDVLRARLKSENIKWVLSKRKPLTYGDRLDLNVTQTIDIGSALAEAKNRINPSIIDIVPFKDVTLNATIDKPEAISDMKADYKSVDSNSMVNADDDIFS